MPMTIDARILREFEARAGFTFAPNNTVFLAMIGSHSHGTYVPPEDPQAIDDVDYMGVVVPPPQLQLGLQTWEHCQFQVDELDVVIYSLQKFIRLLLKSNPNVLGTLWLRPADYVVTSVWSDDLIRQRHIFSSLHAYSAFIGYAHGQFERMIHFNQALTEEYTGRREEIEKRGWAIRDVLEADDAKLKFIANDTSLQVEFLRRFKGLHRQHFSGYMGEKRKRLVAKYGYDCKNAAHLIRLMRMCIEFLETGQLNVYRTRDAEHIKSIKAGRFSLEEVKGEAMMLFEQAKHAKDANYAKLLPEPWTAGAESLLINMTFQAWGFA
jgi:predicted nucleotidyltransferase